MSWVRLGTRDQGLSLSAVLPQGLCHACPRFKLCLAVSPSLPPVFWSELPASVHASCSLDIGGEVLLPLLSGRVCGSFLSIVTHLTLELYGHFYSWGVSRARNSQRDSQEGIQAGGLCGSAVFPVAVRVTPGGSKCVTAIKNSANNRPTGSGTDVR